MYKWLEAGFKVKPGEHAVKVRNLRLFHRSQVEPMTAVEKKQAVANLEAKRSAKTSDKLPVPSPVEPPVVLATKRKAKAKAPAQSQLAI